MSLHRSQILNFPKHTTKRSIEMSVMEDGVASVRVEGGGFGDVPSKIEVAMVWVKY